MIQPESRDFGAFLALSLSAASSIPATEVPSKCSPPAVLRAGDYKRVLRRMLCTCEPVASLRACGFTTDRQPRLCGLAESVGLRLLYTCRVRSTRDSVSLRVFPHVSLRTSMFSACGVPCKSSLQRWHGRRTCAATVGTGTRTGTYLPRPFSAGGPPPRLPQYRALACGVFAHALACAHARASPIAAPACQCVSCTPPLYLCVSMCRSLTPLIRLRLRRAALQAPPAALRWLRARARRGATAATTPVSPPTPAARACPVVADPADRLLSSLACTLVCVLVSCSRVRVLHVLHVLVPPPCESRVLCVLCPFANPLLLSAPGRPSEASRTASPPKPPRAMHYYARHTTKHGEEVLWCLRGGGD